jgi:hypothetical protein
LHETDEYQRLATQNTGVLYKLLHFVRFALSISRNRIRTGDIPSIAFCGLMAHLLKMALDHDKRRRDIAWITIDVIAREGLEAATIRLIAAEAGCNTTAITHLPRKPTLRRPVSYWTPSSRAGLFRCSSTSATGARIEFALPFRR